MDKLFSISLLLLGLIFFQFGCNSKDDTVNIPVPTEVLDSISVTFNSTKTPGIAVSEALPFNECGLSIRPFYRPGYAQAVPSSPMDFFPTAVAATATISAASEGRIGIYSDELLNINGKSLTAGMDLVSYFRNDNGPEKIDTLRFINDLNFLQLKNSPDSAIAAHFFLRYIQTDGEEFQSNSVKVLIQGR